jgi:hypothetical protein
MYFLPLTVEVAPAFLQEAPALTAATACSGRANTAIPTSTATILFMAKE